MSKKHVLVDVRLHKAAKEAAVKQDVTLEVFMANAILQALPIGQRNRLAARTKSTEAN